MPAPSSNFFPDPGSPTPGWLEGCLREAGRLPHGRVETLEIENTGAFNSRTSRLRVVYSQDAPALPRRLVLKCNTAEAWSMEAGRLEVDFYRLVDGLNGHPEILPPCLACGYDERSGDSYLLLEDLSATHLPPITRAQQVGIVEGVPAPADREAVTAVLARFHAFWWDHPLLHSGRFEVGYWSRNQARFELYLQKRRAAWEALLARDGGSLSAEMRERYGLLFARLPGFYARFLEPRFDARRNLTLVHGDAYFCNFLTSRAEGGKAYLLDWQSPGVDLAGYDLANLLAAFWTREQRQQDGLELGLLRRYLNELQANGVREYGWEDLCADYQAGLIFWALMPVQDAAGGAERAYWQPKMRCVMDAFEDWGCAKALEF